MTRYKVIESSYLHCLESDVNEALNDGWELSGSLVVVDNDGNHYYYQPMVKTEVK